MVEFICSGILKEDVQLQNNLLSNYDMKKSVSNVKDRIKNLTVS